MTTTTPPTKEEIDAVLVRCGLLPQDQAITKIEQYRQEYLTMYGKELPPNRCTGRTTLKVMEAIVRMERGENIRFVADTTRMAQHMTNEVIDYTHKLKEAGSKTMYATKIFHPRAKAWNNNDVILQGEPMGYTEVCDHDLD